jgi:hypothetical protein
MVHGIASGKSAVMCLLLSVGESGMSTAECWAESGICTAECWIESRTSTAEC